VLSLTVALTTALAGLGLELRVTFSGINGASASAVSLGDVSLEPGSTLTPMEFRPYSAELAMCQRYLPAFNGTVGGLEDAAWGATTSTSGGIVGFVFPVEPRVAPTGITVANLGNFSFTTMTANAVATAITFGGASKRIARVNVTGTGTPYTVNHPAILYGAGASTQLLFTGCEL
jgi:hypothetical protein